MNMHCTQCGASVPGEARFCGACGAPVGGKAASGAAASGGGQGAAKPPSQAPFFWAAGIIIGLLLLTQCGGSGETGGNTAAPRTAAPAAAKGPLVDAAACREQLAKVRDTGLIKSGEGQREVQVDEGLWAAIPADTKRGVAATLRCARMDGAEQGAAGYHVIVTGFMSGRELARATSLGVELK